MNLRTLGKIDGPVDGVNAWRRAVSTARTQVKVFGQDRSSNILKVFWADRVRYPVLCVCVARVRHPSDVVRVSLRRVHAWGAGALQVAAAGARVHAAQGRADDDLVVVALGG